MLRTIVRNEAVVRHTINRAIRVNTIRCLTTEGLRRVQARKHESLIVRKQIPNAWRKELWRAYSSHPPHTKVPLPALSPTMESGSIVSWSKKEGDKLNEGDLLAEIETDKATMGFETPEEGYLAKILKPAGTKDIKIGEIVCIIVAEESDVAAFKDFKASDAPSPAQASAPAPSAPAPAPVAAPPPPVAAPAPAPVAPSAGKPLTAVEQRGPRVYASPMAKRLAEVQNLRLEGQGSGMYGSITSKDLGGMAAGGAAHSAAATFSGPSRTAAPSKGQAFVDIPLSGMRATIAKRLTESKQTIPHYYLTQDCAVDKLLSVRARFNNEFEKKGVRLSINDFIVKAAAIACRKVPEANSHWMGDKIRQYSAVDMCVAVSTDKGLLTPIIFDADSKGLEDISWETKDLAKRARDGKLKPEEFQGGTFTISNLGMFGTQVFSAVINPPQAGILAIGGTQERLVRDEKELYKDEKFIQVTLSADHRVMDGAVGAEWLQYFKMFIEDPTKMLL